MSNAILLAVISIVGFITAYFVYGKFIGVKILGLDPDSETPAHVYEDGHEYVPTNKFVLFGHHFASIAGLGPIVGPAIAVIWGWLPAVLWVFFGTIFLGAVHDFVVLGISLKFSGRSIGDITKDIIGRRARLLFLFIIFFALALAMGAFALIIALLFNDFHPQAVIPTFSLIGIAVVMGLAVYKFRVPLKLASAVGLTLVFITMYIGIYYPFALYPYFAKSDTLQTIESNVKNDTFIKYCYVTDYGDSQLKQQKSFAENIYTYDMVMQTNTELKKNKQVPIVYHKLIPQNAKVMIAFFEATKNTTVVDDLKQASKQARDTWIYILLAYAVIASVLPVWLLLQPRDYLNSFQLYIGLGLVYIGLFIGAPMIVAPAVNVHSHLFVRDISTGIPAMFPFLFITIACGAISGFHCLVSSGTTVRQVKNERDAQFIGYGSMLTEGALAIVVILACTAGFSSEKSWGYFYRSWGAASGLGEKLAAFVDGSANFIAHVGIPVEFAKTLMAVMIVGFAMTTLDSATRLLRYNIEEIGKDVKVSALQNRYIASILAAVAIAFFALMKIGGKPAGLTLWALFGTTNQLLAGIALLVATMYLYKNGKPIIYTFLPMVFILGMAVSAMIINGIDFINKGNTPLILVGGTLFFMAIWLCIEAFIALKSFRQQKQIQNKE
ncbi:carbon starvation CstA family protein [Candidatus Uabimicrobium amorphum]|uniref:Carbon starvation protein A n=1 Tax=Uabimicrobium amorphum TaxID=2596890 RepID=A0A5S9IPG4_UABAM|nr:carbon starvation protein A [Candidatus Uabimicrobium amorphum]BBM84285.1 carbon starvation protein A [Candidatus Uabimicrobium amorphum]